EISVDGMRLTDEKGNILAVNEAFCKTVEMTKDKLIYQPFPVIYDQAERKEALEMYTHDLQQNALKTHFEHERILWNGKKIWFDFTNSFLSLPGIGKIVLSAINDITKRKTAEINLLKSEERYRMLFNNANDAVFMCHIVDDKWFGDFIEINNPGSILTRYSIDELKQTDFYRIIPSIYSDKLRVVINKLINNKHVIFEVSFLRKDGREVPVEISSHLFEYNDRPTILSMARNITERKQSEEKLKQSSELLRNLASRLQAIREEERTVIAREIHDELGQNLTVMKMQISLISNKLRNDQQLLKNKLDSASKLIDQTVESVQKISAKLRPGILDELGLIPAIEWQSQNFEEMTGIVCDYSLLNEDIKLDREKSTAIFRIFQEALTNVARHANAKKISVLLRRVDNSLILEITDNGRGIRKGQPQDQNSLGLLGMKERALVLGGSVSINGVPDQGTNVKVEMPLEENSSI
ncbi:PAS domain S-box protein, partial [Calditrichota bacterium]